MVSAAAQISWRLSDEPVASGTPADQTDPAFRAACKTKIFLGYTSNLISAGTREQIRCLVQVGRTPCGCWCWRFRALEVQGFTEALPSLR